MISIISIYYSICWSSCNFGVSFFIRCFSYFFLPVSLLKFSVIRLFRVSFFIPILVSWVFAVNIFFWPVMRWLNCFINIFLMFNFSLLHFRMLLGIILLIFIFLRVFRWYFLFIYFKSFDFIIFSDIFYFLLLIYFFLFPRFHFIFSQRITILITSPFYYITRNYSRKITTFLFF